MSAVARVGARRLAPIVDRSHRRNSTHEFVLCGTNGSPVPSPLSYRPLFATTETISSLRQWAMASASASGLLLCKRHSRVKPPPERVWATRAQPEPLAPLISTWLALTRASPSVLFDGLFAVFRYVRCGTGLGGVATFQVHEADGLGSKVSPVCCGQNWGVPSPPVSSLSFARTGRKKGAPCLIDSGMCTATCHAAGFIRGRGESS